MLYRLLSLKYLKRPEFAQLKQQDDQGVSIAYEKLLGYAGARPREEAAVAQQTFNRRFISLGLEAFRRGAITRSKLEHLTDLARCPRMELAAIIDGLDINDEADAIDAEIPDGLLQAVQKRKT